MYLTKAERHYLLHAAQDESPARALFFQLLDDEPFNRLSTDQATGKGLRHAYGVAMMTAAKPVPIHLLAKAMGHSLTKTTEVYLRATGDEERNLLLAAWD
ncbi:tyrosine-type recombinase/integrase [Neptunomonas antarctica]|uniref:Phage integrase family protein n=1 Tax=Neptunomonas antarctica TaxID=619304 RepID=A0A1N7LN73_9GAMM|nr:tyrosine-type recombinase/integrase [Neptunomonas antarctica]SIS75305.1 Phage integrase family protein [Neptunomonas antarctica]